jgi:Na+-transporting methylmalonyl-CoA/oxaloacetate decarboxylase gamma subunit
LFTYITFLEVRFMKNVYLVVILLVAVVMAMPAVAEETPVPVPEAPAAPAAPAAEDATEVTGEESGEVNFTPAWAENLNPVFNCPGYEPCGYQYNKLTGCCVATTPVPGCSCGDICL